MPRIEMTGGNGRSEGCWHRGKLGEWRTNTHELEMVQELRPIALLGRIDVALSRLNKSVVATTVTIAQEVVHHLKI